MKNFNTADFLTEHQLITPEQRVKILSELEKPEHAGMFFLECAVSLGFVPEIETIKKISAELKIPYINLKNLDIDEDAVKLIAEETARNYQLLAMVKSDKLGLFVVTSNPDVLPFLDNIRMQTGFAVLPCFTHITCMQWALDEVYLRDMQYFKPVIFSEPVVYIPDE